MGDRGLVHWQKALWPQVAWFVADLNQASWTLAVLHSSWLVIAQVGSAMVPTNPLPHSEVGPPDSWKSSFSNSFILIFVQAFWGCWLFVAGSPCWGPTRAAAADLHACASLPTSCRSAACADPSWLGLGFVSFNAANPQILCRTNTGQLKNDSFFLARKPRKRL